MSTDGFSRHTPILSGVRIVRALSFDSALLLHLGGVLSELTDEWIWSEVGDSVDDVVTACSDMVQSWYAPMNIGQIVSFIGALPPGWLAMDGGTYSGDVYPELFDAIDSQFKDVGQNEFTLPDLGGLFPVSSGVGYVLGDTGGAVSVSLSVDEMPAHSHNYTMPVAAASIGGAGPPVPAVPSVTPGTPTSSSGSGNAHENLPPYITLNYGVFSGRL